MKKPLMKLLLNLRLPFWILYGLADLTFVVVYYIVRYRRSVVDENLRKSFPEKSHKEQRTIARQFYRHFADYLFETVRLSTMSEKEIRKRIVFKNMELADKYFEQGRSVVAFFSHCGNWEWVTSIGFWSNFRDSDGQPATFAQIYRPLKSKWADEYFLKLRSHFHTHSIPKASSFREMVRMRNSGRISLTGFLSDQKPSHGDHGHITTFLNHPTAIISGTERMARKLDFVALYLDMEKPRRGHYVVNVRLISDNPRLTEEGEITESYAKLLEQTIRRTPHIWLWTHKRWKNKVELPAENTNGGSRDIEHTT